MTTNPRIAEIDKELFILEMKDRFDDKDRALRDRLTSERRALVRADRCHFAYSKPIPNIYPGH